MNTASSVTCSRLPSTAKGHIDSVSFIRCVENGALHHIFPHRTHQSNLIMRETPGKFR